MPDQPSHRTILWRGLRKRCPHCGRGTLYQKGLTMHDRCAGCDLQFLLNQGDPWAFLLFVDRLFILLPVAAIYFGFLPESLAGKVVLFVLLAGLVIVTTPNRHGLCIALDYLTRRHWGDPADELPAV